jgi:hypothetical protein
VRPEEGAGGEEDDHARNASGARDQVGDEPGGEHDRDRLDDVLRGHEKISSFRRSDLPLL